ncbi:MAG: ubiquitin-activating E1 FCCH domain-containing protein, partial [Pseudomonadota bacterium]
IWVDGQRLSYVGSTSACDAKPGTFYVPNASDQASITIHVHPPGSTAPDTDGKIYEATTRKAGVWLYDTPFAEVEDVHARRNHCSYGSICLGRYNKARRCRTSDGNSHNLFMRAFSEVENHLADGWDALGGAATAYIGFDTATGGDGAPASDVWMRLKNCSARQTAQTRLAPAVITAISQATQAVVTAPGHGFANNEFVTISGVTGMTELNNRTFLISSVTTDTFKIKVASLDHGGSSFVNSTSYGAFLSGGDARLAYWMDGGAGSIGFFFHTDGTVTFDSIDIEGCDTIGCSLPFSGDNTRQMTLTNVSARQFKTGVKTLADRTVFRGLEGNVSFMNRPAIPGATLFTADRADQTIEMDGISAVLNSTGTIRSTYPGTTLRFRRGRLTGFNVLFRGDAANQTWDIQEMTNDPNGKGYTVYRFTAGATNLSLISDFNDFGGALDGSEDFVIDNVNLGSLDAYRIATGNDWNSKP